MAACIWHRGGYGEIKKFRDLSDWEEVRKNLAEELGMDEEQIAAIGEVEGDSLDLLETSMALEEAFGLTLPKRRKS
jgi:acyl carrier protein